MATKEALAYEFQMFLGKNDKQKIANHNIQTYLQTSERSGTLYQLTGMLLWCKRKKEKDILTNRKRKEQYDGANVMKTKHTETVR